MSNWENEPATEKQKAKLRFFGCTWEGEITNGQASKAIDKCVRTRPDLEKAYGDRPATQEQHRNPRRRLKGTGETLDAYPELEERQAELDEMDKEYIIDVGMWAELYPGLTWKRVQAAAESLDKVRPGWRDEEKHLDIMLEKVAEQNPQLLERWRKKSAPRKSAPKQRGRRKKSSSAGILIFLIILIWVAYRIISKKLH